MKHPVESDYELFWGSGGHSGPYRGMRLVVKRATAALEAGETYVHVHRRDAAGLGGFWYIGSFRPKAGGGIYPQWLMSREKEFNRRG